MPLYEAEVRQHAIEYIALLNEQGVQAAIVPDSFRDYCCKVSISRDGRDFGNVLIYYKSSKRTYSVQTHELRDKSIAPDLQRFHEQLTQQPATTSTSNKIKRPIQSSTGTGQGVEIYVDGSFEHGKVGYGVVILRDGQVIQELSGQAQTDIEHRQVGGEITAVMRALEWCVANQIEEVTIYYDYSGLEAWATRKWKANLPLTQQYARFMANCPVKITWRKVASHTGVQWNERADQLANAATRT